MIIYNSSAREVLKQNAVLTFTLLKAGRSIERKRNAGFFSELCDIAYIPSQKQQYCKELKAVYERRQGYDKRPQVSLTDPNLEHILSKAMGLR